MARNINEIQDIMLAAKEQAGTLETLEVLSISEQNINDIDSSSKVSIWRLYIWVIAFSQFILEQLWDIFRAETEQRILETRIHTKSWYRDQALNYHYGISVGENGQYDVSNLTIEQITAAKIIANAAAVKIILSGAGAIRLKAVKKVGNDLQKLSDQELFAFNEYMNYITDAGTTIISSSGDADDLKLKIDIYYNDQILNGSGERLDGANQTPVIISIESYLKSIKFNGSLILSRLEDEIQSVDGVEISVIKSAFSKYAQYGYNDVAINNGLINEIRIADAGYMKLDIENLEINYIQFTE